MKFIRQISIFDGVRKTAWFFLMPFFSFLFATATSCSDDDTAEMPSYISDFVLAHTDGDGYVSHFTLEDGSEHYQGKPHYKAETPDSTYRCYGVYSFADDGGLIMHSLQPVFSALPRPAASFADDASKLPRDPVHLTSVWKGRGYINMQLGVLTTGQTAHSFAFCIDSISDGVQYVSLLHMRPQDDPESYTSKVYMSMPLVSPDSTVRRVVFSVLTYDGWKQYAVGEQ